MRRSSTARGTFCVSPSDADARKASWAQVARRTAASASLKVAVRLAYQAAARGRMAEPRLQEGLLALGIGFAAEALLGFEGSKVATQEINRHWSRRSPFGLRRERRIASRRWRQAPAATLEQTAVQLGQP